MTFELDEREQRFVRGWIRQELRKTEKKIASLRRKFQGQADVCELLDRRAWFEQFYAKLGGDPARISNRPAKDTPIDQGGR